MAEHDFSALPPALRTPPDGRYSLEQAVTVWLAIYHGFPPGSPDSRDYRRARQAAQRELEPVIQREQTGVIQRRRSTWLRPSESPPADRLTWRPWVRQSELVELARQHGIEIDPHGQPEPMDAEQREIPVIPAGKPGNAWVNDKAIAYVNARLAEKNPPKIIDACREAARECFGDYHDLEAKAQTIAASRRQLRRKAGITTE